MLTVRLLAPFDQHFPAGSALSGIAAGNLFALVAALDERAPGFADAAELRAAFAVNGVAWPDWSAALPAEGEVMVFPRVAGGNCVRAT